VTVVEAEGFVVSITATNEPVTEGETLTVDYSVTNEGVTADEETLFLKIDELGEYPDSETVALDSGETATGTLSWDTSSGDAGDYTATVESEDDDASTSVTVQDPSGVTSNIKDFRHPGTNGEIASIDETDGSTNWVQTNVNRADEICFANGYAFVASANSPEVVYKVDMSDGSIVQTNGTPFGDTIADMLTINDSVFVSADDDGIYQLATSDLSVESSKSFPRGQGIAVDGTHVYLHELDSGKVEKYAQGALGNGPAESFNTGDLNGYTAPIVDSGRLYVHSPNKVFSLVTSNLSKNWEYSPSGGNQGIPPSYKDNTLYVAHDDTLEAIDTTDQTQEWVWSQPDGSYLEQGITLYDGDAYVTSSGANDSGNLYSVSQFDGSLNWSYDYRGGSAAETPIGVTNDDVVYLVDSGPNLQAIDITNQTEKWHYTPSDGTFYPEIGATGADGNCWINRAGETGNLEPLDPF